jgi:predicted TIM-barrel fold metal-dependent hydrolase
MIVDSHLHVWSGDFDRFPFAEGRAPREPAPVELLNETMDAAGVDAAVMVQGIPYLYDNRYVADCRKRFPDRLAAVGLIDQQAEEAPEVLEQLVTEEGFTGLRIHLASRVDDPAEWAAPDQDRVWAKAEELGASFTIYGPATHLAAVEPIIARFPAVPVILDHVGGVPAPADDGYERLLDYVAGLARYGQVHIKLTPQAHKSAEAFPHRDTFALYRRLFDAYGAQRVMWGTNFPGVLKGVGYGPALEMFAEHLDFVSDEDRAWLLGGTAAKVFGLASD